jgi:hypothetical protein
MVSTGTNEVYGSVASAAANILSMRLGLRGSVQYARLCLVVLLPLFRNIRTSYRMLMPIGDRPAQAKLIAHLDHARTLQVDSHHFFALNLPLFLVR